MKAQKLGLAFTVTSALFIAHALSGFLEQMVVNQIKYAWFLLFAWYFVFMYVTILGYTKIFKVN